MHGGAVGTSTITGTSRSTVYTYGAPQPTTVRERCGINLNPSSDGLSQIWQCENGKALLLGDASNALAAVDNTLPDWDVTHVVCVASRKNADTIRMHDSGMMVTFSSVSPQAEDKKKRKRKPRKAVVQYFTMEDRLRPDQEIELSTYTADPLQAMQDGFMNTSRRDSILVQPMGSRNSSLQDLAAAERAEASQAGDGDVCDSPVGLENLEEEEEHARAPAVLVHCDKGVNRSPTLVLAYLIRQGMSLRGAYQHVLRARPQIDPLPTYRRGLRALELEVHGSSTVSPDEPFAMHVSQLVECIGKGCTTDIDEAMKLRDDAVQALLDEPLVAALESYTMSGAEDDPPAGDNADADTT